VQQEAEPVVSKLRKPCPARLIFLISRLIASVGPFEIPPVVK
jgi:hypothetical protein